MKHGSHILLLVFLTWLRASAITIDSHQDGNWEDSSTWGGYPMSDSFIGDSSYSDTIRIHHHITYNGYLYLSNVFVQLDSNASLCGQDTIHLFQSEFYQEGQTFFYRLLVETAFWECNGGFSLWKAGAKFYGDEFLGHEYLGVVTNGCYVVGGIPVHYTCTFPVTYWLDSTNSDTTIYYPNSEPPPPTFNVYPSPFTDQFMVETFLPDNYTSVTLNIYDMLGRRMKSIPVPIGNSTQTILPDGWAAGIYYLRFGNGGKTLYKTKVLLVK